jgi:hypothetical protein
MKMLNRTRMFGWSAGGVALGLSLSACSPGMFFGGSVDEGVANTKSYRQINFKCSGLDLSSSEIDVSTFRKLVSCFNANGGLDPIEKLLTRLPDADVQPLVDVQNHYVLNNRKLLYTLEQTYLTLGEKQIIDPTFAQLGRLLENEEFISSSIALLKEGYSTSGAGGWPSWGLNPDRKLLKAIERIATKVNATNVADALDIALTFARAQAAARAAGAGIMTLPDLTIPKSRTSRTARLVISLIPMSSACRMRIRALSS